jgi:hypothetical protein
MGLIALFFMPVKRIKIPRHSKVETHCKKCGKDLYYYVDGNNGAISHNSKGICKNKLCQ